MRWKTSYFCIFSVSPPRIILFDKQNQTWNGILTQKLKFNNYSCCQKSINDDHLGQGGWILIPNETPDKLPQSFHQKWNMFFISDQILSFLLFRLRRPIKKGGSCFITGSKHLRPRAFICISVFGTRNEALTFVFDILHQTQVCQTLLHGLLPQKPLVSHYCWGVGVTCDSLVKLCGIRRLTSRCFLFFTAAHNLSKTATTQLNHWLRKILAT